MSGGLSWLLALGSWFLVLGSKLTENTFCIPTNKTNNYTMSIKPLIYKLLRQFLNKKVCGIEQCLYGIGTVI